MKHPKGAFSNETLTAFHDNIWIWSCSSVNFSFLFVFFKNWQVAKCLIVFTYELFHTSSKSWQFLYLKWFQCYKRWFTCVGVLSGHCIFFCVMLLCSTWPWQLSAFHSTCQDHTSIWVHNENINVAAFLKFLYSQRLVLTAAMKYVLCDNMPVTAWTSSECRCFCCFNCDLIDRIVFHILFCIVTCKDDWIYKDYLTHPHPRLFGSRTIWDMVEGSERKDV